MIGIIDKLNGNQLPTTARAERYHPTIRPRRLRHSPSLRAMVRETELSPADFIYPLFFAHVQNVSSPIASMPGVFQL